MLPAAVLLAIISNHPVVRAEQFLAQLGGARYAAREQAGQELVKLGRHALPVLRRGEQRRDLEVAERCKRLVPLAEVEAVRQRVAFVLDTPPKPVPTELPKARRFFALTGDTREARELYVQMYVAHSSLLADVERAGGAAGQIFWSRVDELLSRWPQVMPIGDLDQVPAPRRGATRADLATFLLLSADPGVRPAKCPAAGDDEFPLLRGEAARDALAGPRASPAMRALLFAWLTGPRNFDWPAAEAARVREAFHLLATLPVKEARPLAVRIALDKDQWHVARTAALLALARLGKPTDAAALASLVHDGTLLKYSGDRSVELGDVALATCAILTGQTPNDFGIGPGAKPLGNLQADAHDYGFSDAKARAAARQKWAAWVAARSSVAGGRP